MILPVYFLPRDEISFHMQAFAADNPGLYFPNKYDTEKVYNRCLDAGAFVRKPYIRERIG